MLLSVIVKGDLAREIRWVEGLSISFGIVLVVVERVIEKSENEKTERVISIKDRGHNGTVHTFQN